MGSIIEGLFEIWAKSNGKKKYILQGFFVFGFIYFGMKLKEFILLIHKKDAEHEMVYKTLPTVCKALIKIEQKMKVEVDEFDILKGETQ